MIQAARVKRHSDGSGGEDETGYGVDRVGLPILKTDFDSRFGHSQRLRAGNRASDVLEPASRIIGTEEGDSVVVSLRCDREQGHDRQRKRNCEHYGQTMVKLLNLHYFPSKKI